MILGRMLAPQQRAGAKDRRIKQQEIDADLRRLGEVEGTPRPRVADHPEQVGKGAKRDRQQQQARGRALAGSVNNQAREHGEAGE